MVVVVVVAVVDVVVVEEEAVVVVVVVEGAAVVVVAVVDGAVVVVVVEVVVVLVVVVVVVVSVERILFSHRQTCFIGWGINSAGQVKSLATPLSVQNCVVVVAVELVVTGEAVELADVAVGVVAVEPVVASAAQT